MPTPPPSPLPPSSVTAPAPAIVTVAGQPVPLVFFPSTGDASRDLTVAALHRALSASADDTAPLPLEAALSAEQHLHEWAASASSSSVGGSKTSATTTTEAAAGAMYLRRAHVVWSLLAPDSEGFCAELRELVLSGAVGARELVELQEL